MSTLIRIARGPISTIDTLRLPEGEPFEGGVLDSSGNCIEALYVGGHTGVNTLVGGGFQTYTGNVNSVSARTGVAVLNPATETVSVCVGGTSWFALGSTGTSSIGTVDGGIWV